MPAHGFCDSGLRNYLLSSFFILQTSHFWSVAVFVFSVFLQAGAGHAQDLSVDFNRDIRPLLSENCFACHGPDEAHRATEMRLDQADSISEFLQAGDAEESELYRRVVSADESHRMPPPESNKELSSEQIRRIKKWIEEGGKVQAHWSFVAPSKPSLPQLKPQFNHPVDAFLASTLRQNGLEFSPPADKPTLIRRVAFSLTGLPPTREELNQYLADESPQAYEAMVDRYFASPQFGEEMARHWLDLARYGDTHGMHLDNERQMWAYRDWVVQSFNRNQPFDQFTREQLAGDLLPDATTEQLIATGFNRCNVTTGEGGAIDEEFRYRYAVDRTNTAIQVWTGLTAECAACHDHKFDPISHKEYYSLYAFFNSAADPAMDGNALLTMPVISTADETQIQRLAEYREQVDRLNRALEELISSLDYRDPALEVPRPPAVEFENVWFDDAFPSFGKLNFIGQPTQLVDESIGVPIISGDFALRRQEMGLAQDVFEQATEPLIIPAQARIAVDVWIDEANPPKTVMLQFFKDGWNHRALWGDYDTINWGKPDTMERVRLGDLPEAGRWVHLEFDAEQVGLRTGDQIRGFAFTQFDGTVYWDRLVVRGVSDPVEDPFRSFRAWWKKNQKHASENVPEALKTILKKTEPSRAQSAKPPEGAGPPTETVQLLSSAETSEDVASEAEIRQLLGYWLKNVSTEVQPRLVESVKAVKQAEDKRKSFENSIPQTFVYRDLPQPRESFVMKRGQYNSPGEKVMPDVPAFLPPLRAADPQRPTRLDLAEWLLSDEHPLTSRVIVNRFWQQIFGIGLVKSSGDFGSQGDVPTHPELLDWLALEFRESGWDVKGLIRMLVTSQAFRQQSHLTPALLDRDPENRLLARGPRIRLDAEQIRDNVLFVSGLVRLEMGGRGVKTYQPPNLWEPVGYIDSNTRNYVQDHGPALYRRSLYTFFKRTAPPPFMANFDAPNREQMCTKRERSNTPLQALQLMNDVQHVEAARGLAERMMSHSNDFTERIEFAHQVVLCRQPREIEMAVLKPFYESLLTRYRAAPEDAQKLISIGESIPDAKWDVAEFAALTLVANTLLNLDETLNRN
jgi:hypothetical protein